MSLPGGRGLGHARLRSLRLLDVFINRCFATFELGVDGADGVD